VKASTVCGIKPTPAMLQIQQKSAFFPSLDGHHTINFGSLPMARLATLSDSFNWHQTLGTSNSQYTVNRNPELFFMWFEFFTLICTTL